jgi:hypothetical protein
MLVLNNFNNLNGMYYLFKCHHVIVVQLFQSLKNLYKNFNFYLFCFKSSKNMFFNSIYSKFLDKMNAGRQLSVPIDRSIEKMPAVSYLKH